jgi:hypothetical protein
MPKNNCLSGPKYCPNCGEELLSSVKMCKYCGIDLKTLKFKNKRNEKD